MSNNYIASAVSLAMSSDISEKIGFSMFDAVINTSTDAKEFESTLNLDLREKLRTFDDMAVAISSVISSMPDGPWEAPVKQTGNEVLNLLMLLDKRNFLIHSNSYNSVYAIAVKALGDEGNISFVNNYCLFLYEKFIRGNYGPHSTFPYSVFSIFDLGKSLPEDEKFTTILISAVEVIGEENLIQSMIDSLAPGGTMVIAQSNHGRALYSNTYFTDPYYSINKILLSNDGITVHNSAGGGITTFRKSS